MGAAGALLAENVGHAPLVDVNGEHVLVNEAAAEAGFNVGLSDSTEKATASSPNRWRSWRRISPVRISVPTLPAPL